MFEAKLTRADVLKKILDAIATLVTDANFDVDEDGLKLQAMDNSHVALTSLELNNTAFGDYRCDRNLSLGMNLASLQKIIKCAGNDDEITMRADNNVDVLELMFQNVKTDRMGEYSMKLMDIDQEHLGIPETEYDAEIELPSAEFARIVRDLKDLGESVKIEVSKEGVKFSSEGDIGTAAVTLRPTHQGSRRPKKDEDEEGGMDEDVKPDAEELNGDDGEEEEEANGDEDEGEDGDEEKPHIVEDDDSDTGPKRSKKRKTKAESESPVKTKKGKKAAAPAKSKGKGKAKKEDDDEPRRVSIHLTQSVALTFSVKYLQNFSKSAPLSDYVILHMSNEVPLLVQYSFNGGSVKYYLAPKISDD